MKKIKTQAQLMKERAYRQAYYKLNKEKIIATAKKWQKENPERTKETHKRYIEKHRELANERVRKWQKANPERYRESQRKYYAAHREEILAKAKEKRMEGIKSHG